MTLGAQTPLAQAGAGSLRGRLLRRLALVLSVLLLIASSVAYWNARLAADTAYDRSLLSSARAIAERLYSEDGELAVEVPYVALPMTSPAGSIIRLSTSMVGLSPGTRTCLRPLRLFR